MPRPRLKLSYAQRLRAIALLRQGKSKEQTVHALHDHYHPHALIELVERAYFVNRGPYSLKRFEGKSRDEITRIFKEEFKPGLLSNVALGHRQILRLNADPKFQEKRRIGLIRLHQDPDFRQRKAEAGRKTLRRLNANPKFMQAKSERMRLLHQRSDFARARDHRIQKLNSDPIRKQKNRDRLKRLHADPEFARAHRNRSSRTIARLNRDPKFVQQRKERSSKIMTRLNENPEFARARNARLARLNKDPEFVVKKLAGLRAYWDSLHSGQIIQPSQRSREGVGVENHRLVPLVHSLADDIVLGREQQKTLFSALAQLPNEDGLLVRLFFGLDDQMPLKPAEISTQTQLPFAEIKARIARSLQKLRRNPRVQRVFAESI